MGETSISRCSLSTRIHVIAWKREQKGKRGGPRALSQSHIVAVRVMKRVGPARQDRTVRWGENPERGALKDRIVGAREGAHRSNRSMENYPIGFEPTEGVNL